MLNALTRFGRIRAAASRSSGSVDREHVAGDVRQLGGHDDRREEQVEDRLAAAEGHPRERVGRERRDQYVQAPSRRRPP